MKFYVGIIDTTWFENLRHAQADEVNSYDLLQLRNGESVTRRIGGRNRMSPVCTEFPRGDR